MYGAATITGTDNAGGRSPHVNVCIGSEVFRVSPILGTSAAIHSYGTPTAPA